MSGEIEDDFQNTELSSIVNIQYIYIYTKFLAQRFSLTYFLSILRNKIFIETLQQQFEQNNFGSM